MSERILGVENANEKILNTREVLNKLESLIDNNFELGRVLEDENGPYIIEARAKDEQGDEILYSYTRAGKFPEGFSKETAIDVVNYSGGIPCGGDTLSIYKNGEWVNQN
jgi:hypothetical protein